MKTETRKEEIVQTAAKLFKEKGYSAVTMRDLAKAMGIKAASLYNHINSKQDILKDIIISLAEEFTQGMQLIKSSEATSIEKLKKIVSLHIHITSRNPNGMASLNNDWMHLEEQKHHYIQLRHRYEDDFRQIINEGIKSNEIKKSNSDVMLFSMLSTLRSLYLWIPKKEDLNTETLSQNLSEVLIDGINK
ncbi:MAG: TetR/AcrR family transcriptional regulator [Bacteroidia bacterium]|nr:TetR/AcrR family transcriptional regulator [Bacteroidia bacterium]NND24884.1 TetR/AcrR family transcriptional regulator [Flavobacteriaceae bacterium]MBT8278769.1 TetR/AcrR family transcriptional regulator [Bacteroidia bacterium]NNK60668.1 TetR/AcrR family transcriptional regulator [Flavobacteriaceae bacterium]NNL33519.1 TetR/AcrR family transcriptional regulator [Flavobacteriaceae bacterium]